MIVCPYPLGSSCRSHVNKLDISGVAVRYIVFTQKEVVRDASPRNNDEMKEVEASPEDYTVWL